MQKEKMKNEITKISSKGQIVVPKGMREKLKIEEGDSFVVANYDNYLVLKKVSDDLNEDEIKKMIKDEHKIGSEVKKDEVSMHRGYIC